VRNKVDKSLQQPKQQAGFQNNQVKLKNNHKKLTHSHFSIICVEIQRLLVTLNLFSPFIANFSFSPPINLFQQANHLPLRKLLQIGIGADQILFLHKNRLFKMLIYGKLQVLY